MERNILDSENSEISTTIATNVDNKEEIHNENIDEVKPEIIAKKKSKKKRKLPIKEKIKITPEEIEKFKTQSQTLLPLFISYYKYLLKLSPNDFNSFLSYTTQDLPITFRISQINPYCSNLESEITDFFNINYSHFKNRLNRPKFNFLNNIYQIDKLNKESPIDQELKSILIRENDIGILRQELVAMIPLNLIEINDDDIIFDMCAAPGNKTVQALEIMEEKARNKGILPRGVIIANEIEPKRVSNMSHFFKTQFPMNIIVTSCPGEDFPLIQKESLKPNIIICDVPCSGDGTLRKNKGMRRRWKLDFGYQNHPLQVKLLDKAVQSCRKDGVIVYSTCAINPIENEAVVLSVLNKYKDSIELVDVGKKMNEIGMKFSEGLTRWKVCSKWNDKGDELKWIGEYKEIKGKNELLQESMFHDVYTRDNWESNVFYSDPFNLRRCIRVYSHQNNCGSFFIAVIKKKESTDTDQMQNKDVYGTPLNKEKIKTIGDDLDEFMEYLGIEKEQKKPNEEMAKVIENEIKELNEEKEEEKVIFQKYVNIKEFKSSYDNLHSIFKFKNEKIVEHLYCPRDTSAKIFLFSEKLISLINTFSQMNIEIIRSGVIAFKKERQEFNTKYRLTYYGAILMEPHLSNQIIELNEPSLLELLFNDVEFNIQLHNIPQAYKDKINNFENGTVILIYDSYVITCRKGKNTLALMIPKLVFPSLQKYMAELFKSRKQNNQISNEDELD